MDVWNKQRHAGHTLIELVMVLGAVAVLSAVAMIGSSSPADISLPSQVQMLASDISHAQSLAYTSGQRMRLSIVSSGANGTYSVACVTGTTPCRTDFSVTLQKGVSLTGTSSLDFTSLGQPSAAASYTVASGTSTSTVAVAALTGFVTVSP